ncbi:SusC/RagA family TonB-linked outer membrane protein [Ferruginibacter sp.]|nr:SusC/RagA family TonB-linked outer membrane protein [Ferruginibacter sp.]
MIKHLLKKALLLQFFVLLSCILFAQQKTVTGKVLDADGKPLPSVTVGIKGTTTNTKTDDNGAFSIVVPSNQSVLKFTSAGMIYEEQTVGAKTTIVQVMQKNNKQMEEVVVVGYGTKKRVNVQGAVSTIKAADIEDIPVANLPSALVNRVPGVGVSFASGKPGSTTTINIRNSITFPGAPDGVTNQPLVVIDGIISNPIQWSQSPNADIFENIDASQIEDITFLKDASAAIYGAAGAKGVILITTKKGKAGKPKISYTGYLGTSNEAVKSKSLTAYEHAKFLNDGFELNGTALNQRFSQADLDSLKGIADKSWFDYFWKAGQVQRHTVNVSGGTDKLTFFAGGSYYNEKGNYGDITNDKYSIRTGMNATIVDGLSANISFSSDYNKENSNNHKNANSETDDVTIRSLYLTPKWVPVEFNGMPVPFSGPNPPGNWSLLGVHQSGSYKFNKSQGLTVNASLEYKPKFINGLTARIQFGKNNRNSTGKEYYASYNVGGYLRRGQNSLLYSNAVNTAAPTVKITNNDQMSEGTTISDNYQLIGTLSYAKKIKDHDFDAMVGFDQGEASGRNIFLTKFQQQVRGVDEFWAFSNDLSSLGTITDAIRNPQSVVNAKRSFVSRFNYSFKSKYFFEFIGRLDASSNFAPENRWGFFPTIGLGWRISDENFFKDIQFVNSLKIRANIGLVGEDRVGNRLWESRYSSTTGYLFGNVSTGGLDPSIYPNKEITWEKSRSMNVGFDATILNNKINVSADFYHRYTYDGFDKYDASVFPPTTGVPPPVVNYGKQISWGSEFSVGYRGRIAKDWGFNVDANFGWSNSQLLQVYYNAANLGTYGTNELGIGIGRDPRKYNSSNFGYIAKGILRTQADVDAVLAKNPNYLIGGAKPQVGFMDYEDINGDGVINDFDITTMFDRTTPVIGFGFTVGFTYKQFKLQTNLNLTIGGKRFYDGEARKVPTTTQSAPSFWADHWTPENPNAKFPRADAPLAKENSTFWAVNGTQSRINNAVLSYQMPKALSARLRIPDLRVLVSGTNLFSLINPLKYKDPYTSNYASYPTLRTISLGINASL